jgi:hypothetical protein
MKKYFVLGRLEQPRQDKTLLYWHEEPNELTEEGPFSFVPFEPICLGINSQQGPPLSNFADHDVHTTHYTVS